MPKKITMTTGENKIRFQLDGKGKITVYWGDNKSNEYLLEDKSISDPEKVNNTVVEYENNLKHCKHDYIAPYVYNIEIIIDTVVTFLDCTINQITKLNINDNNDLEELYCHDNQLENLNVENNYKLKKLHCSQNHLTNLNVCQNARIIELIFSKNEIKTIDVSKNLLLKNLGCSNNELKDLDITNNKNLVNLNCSRNQLRDLDIQYNSELEELDCSHNQLTSLDISNNNKIKLLKIINNLLEIDALNNLFYSLHSNGGIIKISDNPGTEGCNHSIATDKGWIVSDDPL